MARPDALFLLIKSLNAGEKALVRQADKGQSGYIALFDLISKQSEYDERKLKKKLAAQGHDVNFAYAKNYLGKHILRTLREAHEGEGGLDRQVLEIAILMERKVFSLAEKLLPKAVKTAWDEERWESYLRLSQMEITLLLAEGGDVEEGLGKIRKINEARTAARARQHNLGEYQDLYALYRSVVKRKQNARNEWDLDQVAALARHPLLAGKEQATSARALRKYYLCKILVEVYMGEHEAAKRSIEESLAHYRAHAFLLTDHPVDYLNDLLRLGGLQLYFKDHKAVEATLKAIRAFQQKHSVHGAELFDKYYRLRIALAIATGDHAPVQAEWGEIVEGIEEYRDTLPWASMSTMLFLLARFQFERRNFKEARLMLEEILADKHPGIREDITSLARILLIFIYFETGAYDLAESASKAARKYLHRRDQLFGFERRILRFLESAPFVAGDKQEIPVLQSLREDLGAIFKDKLEANVLASFDILAWLERRIKYLQAATS